MSLRRCPPRALPLSFRCVKDINTEEFQEAIVQSTLFCAPETTADGFAQQLVDVVTEALDKFAPLQTFRRRPSKLISKWLSPEAVKAKRVRRKCERRWNATGSDLDRKSYRKACRSANALITASRREFFVKHFRR